MMNLNNGTVTREQTVMVYKPTGEVFYESGMDNGGRLYLTPKGVGIPMMFGRKRKKINIGWSQEIIFQIPYENVPLTDRQYYPPSNGLQEVSTHSDMDFIKKYIEIVKVTVTIAKRENI